MNLKVFLPLLLVAVLLNNGLPDYSEFITFLSIRFNYCLSSCNSVFPNQKPPKNESVPAMKVNLVKPEDDSKKSYSGNSKESSVPVVSVAFLNQNSSSNCCILKDSSKSLEIVSPVLPGNPVKSSCEESLMKNNNLQTRLDEEFHFMRFVATIFYEMLVMLLSGSLFLIYEVISYLLKRLKAMETKRSHTLVGNSKLTESKLEDEVLNRGRLEALEQKLKEYKKKYFEEHRQLVEKMKAVELLKVEYNSLLQELQEFETDDEWIAYEF